MNISISFPTIKATCLVILIYGIFFALPQIVSAQSATCETRGVWLNPLAFNTQTVRDATLNAIKVGHLNTVFLAAYPLGGNDGWSDQASFDATYQALKSDGVSVHVWLNSMRRDGSGSVNYTSASEANAHAQWCTNWLTTYPDLDGIHFDNIRYPTGMNTSYIDRSRLEGHARTMKACYDAINTIDPKKHLTAFVDSVDPVSIPNDPKNYLPPWFKSWMSSNPSNGYIFRGEQYRPSNLRVDPITWVKDGYFDGLMPGDYTSSLDLWKRRIPQWKSFMGNDFDKVLFGVAWMPPKPDIVYPDGSHYSGGGANVSAVVSQIEYAQAQGMKGFVIFQYGKVGNDLDLSNALAQGPFKNVTNSCLASTTSVTTTPSPTAPPTPAPSTPVPTTSLVPTNTTGPTSPPTPTLTTHPTPTEPILPTHQPTSTPRPTATHIPTLLPTQIIVTQAPDVCPNPANPLCIFSDNAQFMTIITTLIMILIFMSLIVFGR
jgi:hypothetical protein